MCAFLHGHGLLPPQGYFPCFCCSLSSAGAGVGGLELAPLVDEGDALCPLSSV